LLITIVHEFHHANGETDKWSEDKIDMEALKIAEKLYDKFIKVMQHIDNCENDCPSLGDITPKDKLSSLL